WRLQVASGEAHETLDPNRTDPAQVLRSPAESIGIATPGGSKSRFVGIHLEPLWQRAEAALREAERMMIVGYSFPETDPTAQHRVLSAFAEGNASNMPARRAHL